MKILDLEEKYLPEFLICLEEWSELMIEASNHKLKWYEKMKKKGLRVKIALNDEDIFAGFIQYAPIEHTHVEGANLFFVYCIWVHGHETGRGNLSGKGLGKALLKAAEEDVQRLGAKGLACWGLSLPYWMPAKWFEDQGYQNADSEGLSQLLWKPFSADSEPPKWIKQTKTPPVKEGVLSIHAFKLGWCPSQNAMFERAKKIAQEFGNKVEFIEYDTSDPEVLAEWGHSDVIFLNDEPLSSGEPLSDEEIRKRISEKLL